MNLGDMIVGLGFLVLSLGSAGLVLYFERSYGLVLDLFAPVYACVAFVIAPVGAWLILRCRILVLDFEKRTYWFRPRLLSRTQAGPFRNRIQILMRAQRLWMGVPGRQSRRPHRMIRYAVLVGGILAQGIELRHWYHEDKARAFATRLAQRCDVELYVETDRDRPGGPISRPGAEPEEPIP